MSFNKAKEERKWRIWKDAEEKQMRQLGVNEDTIKKIRVHDWAIFNSERRYYEKQQDAGTYIETLAEDTSPPEIRTVENFLDSIEDEKLHRLLLTVDKLTLQIAVMKIQGFFTAEIAAKLGLTPKSVYRRIDRLKEKIKKILSVEGKIAYSHRLLGERTKSSHPVFLCVAKTGLLFEN